MLSKQEAKALAKRNAAWLETHEQILRDEPERRGQLKEDQEARANTPREEWPHLETAAEVRAKNPLLENQDLQRTQDEIALACDFDPANIKELKVSGQYTILRTWYRHSYAHWFLH